MELLDAIKTGNVTSVKEAIESGAEINQQDKHGWTPLNWAAGRGNLEMVQLLRQHGADLARVGRDQRTPTMIALAAGHREVASYLQEQEAAVSGIKSSHQDRKYCMAFHVRDLRRFSGWAERQAETGDTGNASANGKPREQALSDNDIVYLHENYVVTRTIWRDENVVFDQLSPQWMEFCSKVLNFKVLDDLDLVPASLAKSAAEPNQ